MKLSVVKENWHYDKPFIIFGESKSAEQVIVVTLSDNGYIGRGESDPTTYLGENCTSVIEQIQSLGEELPDDCQPEDLLKILPAGAARNAVDCALWDLRAKQTGKAVWELLSLSKPEPVLTCFTISLDTPENMAIAAATAEHSPILKLKLGGAGDRERIPMIRQAVPDKRLLVDANQAWTPALLKELLPMMSDHGVEMIEQPLPAGDDECLTEVEHLVPICADESCQTSQSIPDLVDRYEMVNIKLDKTGGLTEARRLVDAAQDADLDIMVGCMGGTSLAMAPALLIAQGATYVDLDGPLLLGKDREHALEYTNGFVTPATSKLWG